MKYEKFLKLKFLVLLLVIFSACADKTAQNDAYQNSAAPVRYLKIEDVDFKNFSYSYGENDKNKVTLSNGEKPYGGLNDLAFSFNKTQFADLTKDGNDEAVVVLLHGNGAIASNVVAVYTLENQQPKKLWSFYLGSETNGRLKDIYVVEDNLVVEVFGKNEFDKAQNEFRFSPDFNPAEAFCCPKNFTRFNFNWNGERFVSREKPQVSEYKPEN
ncbi:MAG: hypothetical protein LUM44_24100 [Pyrinomonadaceae bacterium]|nr:hypothetical protein [Pyrinomonadaceae bacterium]